MRIRRLLMLRHGQTEYNANSRMQGQLDTDLSDLGRNQAIAAAEVLAKRQPLLIVSSDLRRALDTATVLSERSGLPVSVDTRLRETTLASGNQVIVRRDDGNPISGIDASIVAELVVDAIHTSKLHIITHGEYRDAVAERMARVISARKAVRNALGPALIPELDQLQIRDSSASDQSLTLTLDRSLLELLPEAQGQTFVVRTFVEGPAAVATFVGGPQ